MRKRTTRRTTTDRDGDPAAVFERFLSDATRRVDAALDRHLPREKKRPPLIHRAMRYTALAEGKRLRPALVLLAYEASGGKGKAADDVAAAVEMVHAFSLIHDDLPAMDDDMMRRGKPSNHVVFGEGVAILAGDGLLTLAFQTLAGTRRAFGADTVTRFIDELCRATGPEGVIGGQVLDLASEGKKVPFSVVEYIHRHKTAKLFMASLRLGGMAAGAKPARLARLERYGQDLGTAFQIVDDILGAVGSFRELGRDPGRDLERGKVTYPSVMGIQAAHRAVDRLLSRADREAHGFGTYATRFRGALALLDRRRRDGDGRLVGVTAAT